MREKLFVNSQKEHMLVVQEFYVRGWVIEDCSKSNDEDCRWLVWKSKGDPVYPEGKEDYFKKV